MEWVTGDWQTNLTRYDILVTIDQLLKLELEKENEELLCKVDLLVCDMEEKSAEESSREGREELEERRGRKKGKGRRRGVIYRREGVAEAIKPPLMSQMENI